METTSRHQHFANEFFVCFVSFALNRMLMVHHGNGISCANDSEWHSTDRRRNLFRATFWNQINNNVLINHTKAKAKAKNWWAHAHLECIHAPIGVEFTFCQSHQIFIQIKNKWYKWRTHFWCVHKNNHNFPLFANLAEIISSDDLQMGRNFKCAIYLNESMKMNQIKTNAKKHSTFYLKMMSTA